MKYEGIPNVETVIEYKYGDVLLSNIRPYLQKIWFAENNGGCSPDVLVLRVFNNDFSPQYIYYSMKRQKFFDYVMENVHGTKMPRGDKGHILKYKLPNISLAEQTDIVSKISAIESKITESEEYLTSLDGKISEILNKYLN